MRLKFANSAGCKTFHRLWLAILPLVAAPLSLAAAESESGIDLFERRIRPLLVEHCSECHTDREGEPEGGLSVQTPAGLIRGGDTGPAIVPGDPDRSLLVSALRWESLEMPPSGKLPAEKVADVVEWIKQGAPVPAVTTGSEQGIPSDDSWAQTVDRRREHWAWQPLSRPALPHGGTRGESAAHPVDAFIGETLRRQGLAMAPMASRRTLIRRLKFVLLGVPPTAAEISAFERDSRGDDEAWIGLVERFLADPAFGERWARHWMDVVRYAETHGSEHDAVIPKSWRYRDYLIRAWNDDLPFDRFVLEHLAGDYREYARWRGITNEAAKATAWLRMTEFYHAPVDVKNEEAAVMENIIDTFGKAFQAQTIACARCHDHKFDPISNEDYYALYGIFSSSRQGMLIVDRLQHLQRHDQKIKRIKDQLRGALGAQWLQEVETWRQTRLAELVASSPAWRAAFESAQEPADPLTLLSVASDSKRHPDVDVGHHQATSSPRYERFAAADSGALAEWRGRGPGFAGVSVAAPGDFAIAPRGDQAITAILPRGVYSHLISSRHGGALRSPRFEIGSQWISAEVVGNGRSRLRLVIENFQGDAILFAPVTPRLSNDQPHWVQLPIQEQWLGRSAYLELLCRDDNPYVGIMGKKAPGMDRPSDGRSSAGLIQVVFHDERHDLPRPDPIWSAERSLDADTDSNDEWHRFVAAVERSVSNWRRGESSDRDARLLAALLEQELLSNQLDQSPEIRELIQRYRQLEASIPVARRVPGVFDDGFGVDARLMSRGNHKISGAPVPRQYLGVLADGFERRPSGEWSGRRDLAQELVDPRNPLTARVIVNRNWHWTFGHGLVRSVDNFGITGDAPSHPDLLDFLATRLIDRGWSLKELVRFLVTSRTFRASSVASSKANRKDPANRWWQHAELRRLEAEAIRDTILSLSGPLNRKMYGPSVPVWLAESYVTNHKPISGPLDGNRRRSIYIEVRRNSPSAFLDVFDRPKPTYTVGARQLTNVPAQALTMMNDPFVLQQAERWAKQERQNQTESVRQTIGRMYRRAFGRPPTTAELERAERLLGEFSIPDGIERTNHEDRPGERLPSAREYAAWQRLAHALLNHKELIYVR